MGDRVDRHSVRAAERHQVFRVVDGRLVPVYLAGSQQVTQEVGVGGGATPHNRHLAPLLEHHVPHRDELFNAVLAQQAVQVLAGRAAAAKLGVKHLAVGDQRLREELIWPEPVVFLYPVPVSRASRHRD